MIISVSDHGDKIIQQIWGGAKELICSKLLKIISVHKPTDLYFCFDQHLESMPLRIMAGWIPMPSLQQSNHAWTCCCSAQGFM